jgi:hypothetical protein
MRFEAGASGGGRTNAFLLEVSMEKGLEKPEISDYPAAVADIGMSMRVINRLLFEMGVRVTGYLKINVHASRCNMGKVRMVFCMEKLRGYLKAHPELTAPPTREEEERDYTAL